MKNTPLQRILLFGDAYGIPDLVARIPNEKIAAIVAAANRPATHNSLQQIAQQNGVPFLIQPQHRDTTAMADFLAALQKSNPDSLLCHSYAMLIRAPILALVQSRAFNVHTALLPHNRGPNPIQWALIHGDAQTGVTLHQMDEGFDSGPIVAQESIPIATEDTWVTLKTKLEALTRTLLDKALPPLLAGDWHATPQDETKARTNPRITPESFEIDFTRMSDHTIYNLIRAQVSPLAGPYIHTPQGKIHLSELVPLADIAALRTRYA